MRSLVIAAIFGLGIITPATATEIRCDGNEENLNAYLALFDVLFKQRDGSRAGEFYAEGFLSNNSDAGGAEQTRGSAAQLERMFSASKVASPDRQIRNDLIICSDDMVSTRMTVWGTQSGIMMGNPATGRPFKFTAMDIFRFKDGMVVERWGETDTIILIRQLGLNVDLSHQPLTTK
ncbi:MAG: ester cyclase [Rhodospirillaceae bacterium]